MRGLSGRVGQLLGWGCAHHHVFSLACLSAFLFFFFLTRFSPRV